MDDGTSAPLLGIPSSQRGFGDGSAPAFISSRSLPQVSARVLAMLCAFLLALHTFKGAPLPSFRPHVAVSEFDFEDIRSRFLFC